MSTPISTPIICTGMMRSGTTLLQTLLNYHPQLSVPYQTHTDFYLRAKKQFLARQGQPPYHVLSHYNEADHYPLSDFSNWLSSQPEFLDKLIDMYATPGLAFAGSKEILIEEFLPWLVSNNIRCIQIIRDPRAVVASSCFGNARHTGAARPVLFDIRNWRKSAQVAAMLASSQSFLKIKFEDLVGEPGKILSRIFNWLGVEDNADSLVKEIQNNQIKANSSFSRNPGIDQGVVDGFRTVLSNEVEAFIRATCQEEMHLQHYLVDQMSSNQRCQIIERFVEPNRIQRAEFSEDYTSKGKRYELQRLADYSSSLNIGGQEYDSF